MRAKLMSGTIWITATRALTNIITSVGQLALARILAPADFGLVALGAAMLGVVSSVTELSLNQALVQHKAPTPEHYNTAWTLNFARSLAVAAIFCLATPFAVNLYHEPRLATLMPGLALGAVLSGLPNPRAAMLAKQLVFWQQFMLQVTQKLVTLVVSLGVALAYHSYWALVWGALAGQAAGMAMSYTVLPFRPRPSLRHWRELFSFSIWLTLQQFVATISVKIDLLLVGGVLGRTALGYYTVGDNLASLPTRETTAPITVTLFPAFSRLTHDRARLAAAYQSAQALVTAIALPAGVGMALIADPLIRLTMGDKWLPAVFLIQVLASVLALQTLGTLSQPLAMAAGETRLLFRRDLQGLILRAPLVTAGMLLGGMTGIVLARSINGTLIILLHMQVVKKVTGLSFVRQVGANARSLISVAAMAAVDLSLSASHADAASAPDLVLKLAMLIGAGGATYIGAHLLLWRIMGRPNGPEREVAKAAAMVLQRLRPAVSPAT
jgi:O-antigen/teichoic acid export membrane protein